MRHRPEFQGRLSVHVGECGKLDPTRPPKYEELHTKHAAESRRLLFVLATALCPDLSDIRKVRAGPSGFQQCPGTRRPCRTPQPAVTLRSPRHAPRAERSYGR